VSNTDQSLNLANDQQDEWIIIEEEGMKLRIFELLYDDVIEQSSFLLCRVLSIETISYYEFSLLGYT
jgi:hypothetical protein